MKAGYRNPPASSRFQKGRSGNPRGRPRGSKRAAPYETILGQKVTVRESGRERRVTASEAFLLHITRKGLEGDGQAARVAMAAIEAARDKRMIGPTFAFNGITIQFVEPGSVTSALEPLKMGRRLDPYRGSVKVKLEPWLVQAALDRLGSKRLSLDEQRTIYGSTRTPHKVAWPEWWEVTR